MLFKIDGNMEVIEPAIKQFCEMAEEEWTKQMPDAREKLRNLKLPLPVQIDNPEQILPDEMLFAHWKEDGAVFIRIPFSVPMQKVFNLPKRKARKNLEGFLKAQKIKAKVSYIGD